jgi:Fe-S cluster assembly ATPase SufC
MLFQGKNEPGIRSREVVWDKDQNKEIAVFIQGQPFETNDPEVIKKLKDRGYQTVSPEPAEEPKGRKK